MKLLALDFSAPIRSVAAMVDGQAAPAVTEVGARVTNTVRMVDEALARAAIEREAVEGIVVGLGPGSYNGIRAAIAFAQGWQIGRGIELRGLGTADGLAEQARLLGWRGRVHVVIDAQRKDLYLATFAITSDQATLLEPLRILSLAEAHLHIVQGDLVCGPEVERWFPDGRLLSPDAAVLARLALDRSTPVPGEALEPIYLRETAFLKAPTPRVIPP